MLKEIVQPGYKAGTDKINGSFRERSEECLLYL